MLYGFFWTFLTTLLQFTFIFTRMMLLSCGDDILSLCGEVSFSRAIVHLIVWPAHWVNHVKTILNLHVFSQGWWYYLVKIIHNHDVKRYKYLEWFYNWSLDQRTSFLVGTTGKIYILWCTNFWVGFPSHLNLHKNREVNIGVNKKWSFGNYTVGKNC